MRAHQHCSELWAAEKKEFASGAVVGTTPGPKLLARSRSTLLFVWERYFVCRTLLHSCPNKGLFKTDLQTYNLPPSRSAPVSTSPRLLPPESS
eukprot:2772071-Rhodomonas_salina.3